MHSNASFGAAFLIRSPTSEPLIKQSKNPACRPVRFSPQMYQHHLKVDFMNENGSFEMWLVLTAAIGPSLSDLLRKHSLYLSHMFQCPFLLEFPGPYCNRTWDGWMCWDDTPAGEMAYQHCPDYFPDFDTAGKVFSFILCFYIINKNVLNGQEDPNTLPLLKLHSDMSPFTLQSMYILIISIYTHNI